MRSFTKDDVFQKVSAAAFGKPLVTNVLRGSVVEAIIALAIEPEWTWCGSDYASWDFESLHGVRLEIKQSSAKQSWDSSSLKNARRPSFDIAPRKGRWEGATYVEDYRRNADVYVFAFHPLTDDSADHREPAQWLFYVLPTAKLPANQKRISLSVIEKLTQPVGIDLLPERLSMEVTSTVPGTQY